MPQNGAAWWACPAHTVTGQGGDCAPGVFPLPQTRRMHAPGARRRRRPFPGKRPCSCSAGARWPAATPGGSGGAGVQPVWGKQGESPAQWILVPDVLFVQLRRRFRNWPIPHPAGDDNAGGGSLPWYPATHVAADAADGCGSHNTDSVNPAGQRPPPCKSGPHGPFSCSADSQALLPRRRPAAATVGRPGRYKMDTPSVIHRGRFIFTQSQHFSGRRPQCGVPNPPLAPGGNQRLSIPDGTILHQSLLAIVSAHFAFCRIFY